MECRQPMWLAGRSNQPHASLIGRATAFLMVAAEAGGDDIIPTLLAAHSDRSDMIEGEVL